MNLLLLQTQWLLITEIAYLILLILVCVLIIYDTRSVGKTLAYLLFAIFVPVVGIFFYFSFGINYRKRKMYKKKLIIDEQLQQNFKTLLDINREYVLSQKEASIQRNLKLIQMLSEKDAGNFTVLPNYFIQVLQNGENLFPHIIEEIKKAKKHIHIEYYIYENDEIGNTIKNLLIEKAAQGVEVRFIYDDFGSKDIRKNIVKELQNGGVKVFPFNKVKLIYLANRLNYRNHRKILVIDGEVSFVGGINISDKYINPSTSGTFWRDTHLMLKGYSSFALQRVFLQDWNFCSNEKLTIDIRYFSFVNIEIENILYAQIISSGPDSNLPAILYSVVTAINSAEKEILLTTPYYIPDEILQESLIMAAMGGIDVKLLVPLKGDSSFVNLTAQSYYEELLRAGVKIYCYNKGFVHSKTFIIDSQICSIGTANLDQRSFDLNFEVSAVIYDGNISTNLRNTFYEDLKESTQINSEEWYNRSALKKTIERFVRLFSPFM